MLGIGERHELPTILLIDDDLVSREVVATVLTMDGYPVHTAETGEAALEKLADPADTPRLILMDAQLPGLSGTELIQKLRAHGDLTIVVISGSRVSAELEAAADGFLMKPFNPDALRNLLRAKAPPQAAEPAAFVVNPVVLAQFRQLMPDATVKQIYTAVVTDLKKRSAALETALAAGNRTEIGRIGHAIKGGCGMAGAQQAANLGAGLEAESNDLDYCRALVADLTRVICDLQSMLEQEFPG
jgi:DNA-binding response OmpR family regulator